jgi:nitrate reductase cytochrome c-type subunit
MDLKNLQDQLRKRFYCKQCGIPHVDKVALVVAEDFDKRTYKLRECWFAEFLKIREVDAI